MEGDVRVLSEEECIEHATKPGALVTAPERRHAIDNANWLAASSEQTAVYMRRQFEHDGPTPEFADHMFAFGWMLYEVTFLLTNRHAAQEDTAEAREVRTVLKRFAECAESLEPKDYAVRAAGAIRAYALVLSKLDHADSYLLAAEQHRAGDRWMSQVLQSLGNTEIEQLTQESAASVVKRRRDAWAVQVQLEAAKAGTACRQIETFLCDPDKLDAGVEIGQRMRQIAKTARAGVIAGVRAIEEFVKVRDDIVADRRASLAQRIWERQAANMAARAHLLLIPALAYLDAAGVPYHPSFNEEVWKLSTDVLDPDLPQPADCAAEIEFIRRQVVHLIDRAELAMDEGKAGLLTNADVAETARVRLHYLVQFPDRLLPTPARRLPYAVGDAAAELEYLAGWLVGAGHDANVIGSASLAAWVEGMTTVRGRHGDPDAAAWYAAWRDSHPRLNRKWRDSNGEA